MLSRSHLTVRSSRTWTLLLALLFLVSLLIQYGSLLASPSTVKAVHDQGLFELDANAVTGHGGAGLPDDWDRVYAGTANTLATQFITDAIDSSPAEHLFTGGGSKDGNAISSWKWTTGAGVQDKNDIEHAYAAAYANPTNGHRVIYFGLDRYAVSGDAFVGFWFFKNPVGEAGGGTFSGTHAVGDILVQVNFTNGGAIQEFLVSEWNGSGLTQLATGLDCSVVGAGDSACGRVNNSDQGSPWAYTPKSGSANTFPSGAFFEGGVDLTALQQATGCFSTFMAETRSSQSLTSTLSDYALGGFSFCAQPEISTSLSGGGQNGAHITVPVGTSVSDQATLTGTAGTPGGTISYRVYTNGTCTTLFANAGLNKALSGGVVPPSDPVAFPDPGTFYWQAVYSGDNQNNTGATSACTAETVTVQKLSPTITTVLSDGQTSSAHLTVAIGTSVTDQATLSGATASAGGTVAYAVYSNNTCTAQIATAGTKTVTNASVPASDAVTFNHAGSFYWQAVYSGDSHNNGATSACTDETVVVNPNHPSISTLLTSGQTSGAHIAISIGGSVTDQATLTGATSGAGGTVTYTVYSNNTCTAQVASGGTKTVTNASVPASDPVTFNHAGTFYWKAVYSGDADNSGTASACTDESVIVNPNTPSIATALSGGGQSGAHITVPIPTAVSDQATLSGATSGAGGTVTYTVYSNNTCQTVFASGGTKAVTNGVAAASDPVTFNAAGTFYWRAVYSGDADNAGAASACQDESVTVLKNTPTITTSLTSGETSGGTIEIGIGDSVTDQATLHGATGNAGGTVTYTVYSDDTCQTVFAGGGTKAVTNGNVGASDPVTFNNAGVFYWTAAYSGDANNQATASACKEEVVGVGKNVPTITTSLTSGEQTGLNVNIDIGESVTDLATLHGATAGAGGTVTYTVYSDNQCQVVFANGGTKSVTNGVAGASDAVIFTHAGTYYWRADYSGDADNAGVVSGCTDESVVVSPNQPSISTVLSGGGQSGASISVLVGSSVSDQATLSGATAGAGGSVSYKVYTDNQCTQQFADAGTKSVTSGVPAASNPVAFTQPGMYYWQASYSGDADNLPATSVCTAEVLTVTAPNLHVTKSVDKAVAAPGDVLHYTLTLVNGGDGDALNVAVSDDISALLAHGTYNDDCSNGCTFSSSTLSWSALNIGAGQTLKLTFSVTLATSGFLFGQTTNLPNTVVVTGQANNCLEGSEDAACSTNTTVPLPAVAIEKTLTSGFTGGTASGVPIAKVGDTLTYTLTYTVTNGPAANVVITDDVPVGLAYVAGSASNGGTISGDGRTLTWNLGTVATGTGHVTYRVTVLSTAPDQTQPIKNVAVITAQGTNCEEGSTDEACSSEANVQVIKVAAITPPATDAEVAGSMGGASNLPLILLVVGGLAAVIGLRAAAPARVRQRRRRR